VVAKARPHSSVLLLRDSGSRVIDVIEAPNLPRVEIQPL
jgi:hypothetical protein